VPRSGVLGVVAVACTLLVVTATAATASRPSAGGPSNRELRMNHVQVLASHNSYHLLAPVPLTGAIGLTLEYSHAPLDQQLETQGVRSFELDTVNPPGDEFPVLHEPSVDAASNCTPITHCLDVIAQWSKAHPRHVPIVVLVEPKDGALELQLDPQLAAFDAAAVDALDAQVRDTLGKRLITPDEVRGKAKTLRAAVTGKGWPTLARARGRVLVAVNDRGEVRRLLLAGHPSLRDRAMFVTAEPTAPAAAVVLEDTPDEARIRELVEAGFIVRTRADADLVEARTGDTTRRETALASGAQIVSTDFPVPNPPVGGDYVVQIPDGTPARCNPVIAPASCRPEDVEDPEQLTARAR
jgi:hypothetical protein